MCLLGRSVDSISTGITVGWSNCQLDLLICSSLPNSCLEPALSRVGCRRRETCLFLPQTWRQQGVQCGLQTAGNTLGSSSTPFLVGLFRGHDCASVYCSRYWVLPRVVQVILAKPLEFKFSLIKQNKALGFPRVTV